MTQPTAPTTSLSLFEILGPVMVGPSSSHTAGALRCAQVAASLLETDIAEVTFTLWNSFAQTYRGHGTDRALVAGILGLATDDKRIRNAFDLAKERNLAFSFEIGGENPLLHPNTVDIAITSTSGMRATVRGESLGGGKIRISQINGVEVDISGAYCTLFVAHKDAPGALATLTALLAEAHVNIAFCRTYRFEAGGQAYTVFETDEHHASDPFLAMVRNLNLVDYATFIEVPGTAPTPHTHVSTIELFTNAQTLLHACEELDATIGQVMAKREEHFTTPEAIKQQMDQVIRVMKEETSDPIVHPQPSLGGFIGGEAQAVASATTYQDALMGSVQTKAVAQAMAVLERSASMGVIVAAPTAGSAGVVPGSILAVWEHLGAPEAELEDALYCAGAIGLILSTNACVAGAEGGCQAEVGSAAAMAAAGLVQLLGGTPQQCLHAASLTLANLLGLVCDPVGGLVEVPCQNRNAIGVAAAFSAAHLALSGIKSLVPFDEMAQVMLDVGHALPHTLRETALGGIAQAPSACRACGGCA